MSEKKAFGSGPNGGRHSQIDERKPWQFIGWEKTRQFIYRIYYVDRSEYFQFGWNIGQPTPEPSAQRGTVRHGRRVGNLQPIEPRRPPTHLGQAHIIFNFNRHHCYLKSPITRWSSIKRTVLTVNIIIKLSVSLSPYHQVTLPRVYACLKLAQPFQPWLDHGQLMEVLHFH